MQQPEPSQEQELSIVYAGEQFTHADWPRLETDIIGGIEHVVVRPGRGYDAPAASLFTIPLPDGSITEDTLGAVADTIEFTADEAPDGDKLRTNLLQVFEVDKEGQATGTPVEKLLDGAAITEVRPAKEDQRLAAGRYATFVTHGKIDIFDIEDRWRDINAAVNTASSSKPHED